MTAESKEDLAVKLLKEACEKKRLNFEVIPYSEIAFDQVNSTERFLFAGKSHLSFIQSIVLRKYQSTIFQNGA